MMHPKHLARSLVALGALLASSAFAEGGPTISKIKDGKALVLGAGAIAKPGDYLLALDEDGRLAGLVKVQAVKGDRAIVQISGGDVTEGARLAAYAPAGSGGEPPVITSNDMDGRSDTSTEAASTPSSPAAMTSASSANDGMFFPDQPTRRSILGGSILRLDQTMRVNFSAGSVEMKGEAWQFGGFWEPGWNGPVRLRGVGAITTSTLSGTASTASCASTRSCEFSSFAAMLGAELVYGFWENRHFRTWASGGARAELPLTKSTNAVKEEGLTIAPALSWGLGIEWRLGRDRVIPIGFVSLMNLQQAEGVETVGSGFFAGYGTTF